MKFQRVLQKTQTKGSHYKSLKSSWLSKRREGLGLGARARKAKGACEKGYGRWEIQTTIFQE